MEEWMYVSPATWQSSSATLGNQETMLAILNDSFTVYDRWWCMQQEYIQITYILCKLFRSVANTDKVAITPIWVYQIYNNNCGCWGYLEWRPTMYASSMLLRCWSVRGASASASPSALCFSASSSWTDCMHNSTYLCFSLHQEQENGGTSIYTACHII